jgi:hypothetical protein
LRIWLGRAHLLTIGDLQNFLEIMMKHTLGLLSGASLLLSLMACGSAMKAPMVAEAITVPAGNQLVMMAVGSGELTYQCRAKAAMPGAFEWVFVEPNAVLADKDGMTIGKYYAGPTWEANDGSKVTGKQLATAPGAANAIALQLVKPRNLS